MQGAVLAGASQGGQVKCCFWTAWNNGAFSLEELASVPLPSPHIAPALATVQRMLGTGPLQGTSRSVCLLAQAGQPAH